MRVVNRTRYSGVVIRSIFLSVLSEVESVIGRRDAAAAASARVRGQFIRARCTVTWTYTRGGGIGASGRASLGGGRCRLRLPREEVQLVEVLWLVRHEVMHLFGVEHRDMPHSVMHRTETGYGYVREAFPHLFTRYGEVLRWEPLKAPKAKPTSEDLATQKIVAITDRLTRWDSKRRRAENAIKKLERQRRYYEGKLAIAAKGPT
jgi:hypothetical protein